jgi:hypothetical protein
MEALRKETDPASIERRAKLEIEVVEKDRLAAEKVETQIFTNVEEQSFFFIVV